jgi:hypothetical protein
MIKYSWLLSAGNDISFPAQNTKENAGSVAPKKAGPIDLISFLR